VSCAVTSARWKDLEFNVLKWSATRERAAPGAVPALTEWVLTSARPSVGELDERVGILVKRFLPFRVFEKAGEGKSGP
jgi:hypothetical protein